MSWILIHVESVNYLIFALVENPNGMEYEQEAVDDEYYKAGI